MSDLIESVTKQSEDDKNFKAPITGYPIPALEGVETYRSATENQIVLGENLEQTTEIAELFKKDKLLARAMSPISIARQEDGSRGHDYQVWDEEAELMDSSSGLTSTSCTLLVSGEEVPTYKPYGFLMDADKSEIIHIAEMDSGSSGNVVDGDFRANSSGIENLDQLATIVRQGKKRRMNEVNANFKKESVKGLFALKAGGPTNKMDILLVQKHLETKGFNLPMYIYDFEQGTLDLWQPTIKEVEEMSDKVKSQNLKLIYGRELRQAGY